MKSEGQGMRHHVALKSRLRLSLAQADEESANICNIDRSSAGLPCDFYGISSLLSHGNH
jgi:hypothetical protein